MEYHEPQYTNNLDNLDEIKKKKIPRETYTTELTQEETESLNRPVPRKETELVIKTLPTKKKKNPRTR